MVVARQSTAPCQEGQNLARCEMRANGRMDAIRADQRRAARGVPMLEPRHAIGILVETDHAMPGPHLDAAGATFLDQQHSQEAAMDAVVAASDNRPRGRDPRARSWPCALM